MPKRARQLPLKHRARVAAAPLEHMDPAALAAAQGVRPVMDLSDLYADFWPQDETADEFIDAVREWRREGNGSVR